MSLFRKRRDDEQLDTGEPQPELGLRDSLVLEQLKRNGADLSQPRHVLYYSYASTEETANEMARQATDDGYEASVRDPLPQFADQWLLVCETRAVTTPEFVHGADGYFVALAARHGAEYDGWEASL